ncbi:MAG: hypothetical protein QOG04_1131 [Actinomycetota bacterium]|jgi:hypothetical protein|nr:hypothetical protein [Actinomycetota bacterium]
MPAFREAKIVELTETRPDLIRARVSLPSGEAEAVGFPAMLGPLTPGDRVVVNTTGIDLGLGTGGVAFILWNLDAEPPAPQLDGHIMKVRYTPWQTEVVTAEAPESPHHDKLKDVESIDGMPVVACTLHSQVAAIAAGIKAERPDARVGYLMTDGACLPIAWSDLVRDLKSAGLLDVTCTSGHAFGGDLEAVTIFSGLAALKVVGECDVVIAGMGPGVVGTGTTLGHTAIEQGHLLDAASALGGKAIACVRISYADKRERHHGISHHTLTALRLATHRRATVVLPELPDDYERAIEDQVRKAGIEEKHDVTVADGEKGLTLLEGKGIEPSSMGRRLSDVRELFLAGSAAGGWAAGLLDPGPENR